jgi:hypothetical protein
MNHKYLLTKIYWVKGTVDNIINQRALLGEINTPALPINRLTELQNLALAMQSNPETSHVNYDISIENSLNTILRAINNTERLSFRNNNHNFDQAINHGLNLIETNINDIIFELRRTSTILENSHEYLVVSLASNSSVEELQLTSENFAYVATTYTKNILMGINQDNHKDAF